MRFPFLLVCVFLQTAALQAGAPNFPAPGAGAAGDIFAIVSDRPLSEELGQKKPFLWNSFVGLLDGGRKIVIQDDTGFMIFDRTTGKSERNNLYKWGTVSPDGSRILPENSLEVMNLDASGRRRLVESEDDVYVKTAWMPNGDILLIEGRVYEETLSQKEREHSTLLQLRLTDGSNSTQVLKKKDLPIDPLNNAVLFSPQRDRLAAQYSLGKPRWVKIVDLNTMTETPLPDDQNAKGSSVLYCWSPDGKYLVYQAGGKYYLSDVRGGCTRLDVTNCLPVAFTPDSKFLLVKRFRVFRTKLEYSDLHMFGLDGRNLQNLTRNPRVMEGGVFLLDDGSILYSDTTDFKKEYFRMLRIKER